MSLIFTEQLDKPSELRSKPSNLLRPIFGALYGFDSTAVAPANTFTTLTVADTDTNAIGSADTITFTVQPSVAIAAGGTLTLTGMQGTQTANNASLTVGGAGAAIFGSSGSWTQSTGTLVLTVAGGQSLPTGSDTVITFDLTNASSVQSGKTVSVSSNTFTTANATGTVLDTIAIFNVTTRNTEANILASTPTNPTDEVNIAFGTDTGDFYIYNGTAWLIFNDTPFNSYSVSLDGSDDYIETPDKFDFIQQSCVFTVSVWLKVDNVNANALQGFVSNNYTSSSYGLYLFYDNRSVTGSSKDLRVLFSADSVNTDIIVANGITDTNWHHYAITCTASGGILALYVDGSLVDSTTAPTTTTNTANGNLRFGSATNDSAHFDGLIDEVAVFNTALSASQVTNIYKGEANGGSGGTNGVPGDLKTFSPVGWWRMGDNNSGSGTTITDQGSGGNNGTLTNGATFSTTVPS